jgi:hypothetical protein
VLQGVQKRLEVAEQAVVSNWPSGHVAQLVHTRLLVAVQAVVSYVPGVHVSQAAQEASAKVEQGVAMYEPGAEQVVLQGAQAVLAVSVQLLPTNDPASQVEQALHTRLLVAVALVLANVVPSVQLVRLTHVLDVVLRNSVLGLQLATGVGMATMVMGSLSKSYKLITVMLPR